MRTRRKRLGGLEVRSLGESEAETGCKEEKWRIVGTSTDRPQEGHCKDIPAWERLTGICAPQEHGKRNWLIGLGNGSTV